MFDPKFDWAGSYMKAHYMYPLLKLCCPNCKDPLNSRHLRVPEFPKAFARYVKNRIRNTRANYAYMLAGNYQIWGFSKSNDPSGVVLMSMLGQLKPTPKLEQFFAKLASLSV